MKKIILQICPHKESVFLTKKKKFLGKTFWETAYFLGFISRASLVKSDADYIMSQSQPGAIQTFSTWYEWILAELYRKYCLGGKKLSYNYCKLVEKTGKFFLFVFILSNALFTVDLHLVLLQLIYID